MLNARNDTQDKFAQSMKTGAPTNRAGHTQMAPQFTQLDSGPGVGSMPSALAKALYLMPSREKERADQREASKSFKLEADK
jgi:hypothetical protein